MKLLVVSQRVKERMCSIVHAITLKSDVLCGSERSESLGDRGYT